MNEYGSLIAVTGSTGKTTCVHLLYYFFKRLYKGDKKRIGEVATSVSKIFVNGKEKIIYENYTK